MSTLAIIAIVIALIALVGVTLVYARVKSMTEGLLRELNHSDPTLPDEKVPGTEWKYCSGDCDRVNRPNNKIKCRPSTCRGLAGCSCQVFRRESPVPQDWDGEYEHVGSGDSEHTKETGYAYFCWCVKAA